MIGTFAPGRPRTVQHQVQHDNSNAIQSDRSSSRTLVSFDRSFVREFKLQEQLFIQTMPHVELPQAEFKVSFFGRFSQFLLLSPYSDIRLISQCLVLLFYRLSYSIFSYHEMLSFVIIITLTSMTYCIRSSCWVTPTRARRRWCYDLPKAIIAKVHAVPRSVPFSLPNECKCMALLVKFKFGIRPDKNNLNHLLPCIINTPRRRFYVTM